MLFANVWGIKVMRDLVCGDLRRGRVTGERDQDLLSVLIAAFPFLSCALGSDGSFPMIQRSFPPSFWNSTYQPSSVTATLSSPLAAAAHSELPFAAAADPYAPASLHGHLHQGGPEPWHHAHHHHHHHHPPYIGTQSTAYPRPATVHEVYGPHFDPRYSSLLVPTASVRPHRLTPASVPTPVSPPCELGKSEVGAAAAWTTSGPFPSTAGDMAQSLGLNVDAGKELPTVFLCPLTQLHPCPLPPHHL